MGQMRESSVVADLLDTFAWQPCFTATDVDLLCLTTNKPSKELRVFSHAWLLDHRTESRLEVPGSFLTAGVDNITNMVLSIRNDPSTLRSWTSWLTKPLPSVLLCTSRPANPTRPFNMSRCPALPLRLQATPQTCTEVAFFRQYNHTSLGNLSLPCTTLHIRPRRPSRSRKPAFP